MNRDKEALEDLISSEGWAVYLRLVKERYDDAHLRYALRHLGDKVDDLALLGAKTGQILVAHEVAEELVQLPYAQINYLDSLEETKREIDGK